MGDGKVIEGINGDTRLLLSLSTAVFTGGSKPHNN